MKDVNVISSCEKSIEKNRIQLIKKKQSIKKFIYFLSMFFAFLCVNNWLKSSDTLQQQIPFIGAMFLLMGIMLGIYLLFAYAQIFKLRKQSERWRTTINTLQNISKYQLHQIV